MKTGKHSIPVKLVFVRNRNKKSEYIIILTTDCSLSDSEVIRIYGGRWSIEVFFRATKSLLDLDDEFQGLSYDMTIGSTGLVFTRYIILEWLRRKSNDQKTICELFYVCCEDIQDIELLTQLIPAPANIILHDSAKSRRRCPMIFRLLGNYPSPP